MDPFSMVVAIVIVVTIGNVIKARHGIHKDRHGNEVFRAPDPAAAAETAKLRDEIRALKDRVQVLERVVTDNETGSIRLEREIEALRTKNNV